MFVPVWGVSARNCVDVVSADDGAATLANPFGGFLGSLANIGIGAAAGFVLLLLGVPGWLILILAACCLVASFGRFTRGRREAECERATE